MNTTGLPLQIALRMIFIVAASVAAGWLLASGFRLSVVMLCLLLVVAAIINLIYTLNATNRKISYFLESVQNEDSALSFPTELSNSPVHELYMGLKKVNQQIQQLKIESRQQEQYFQTLLEHVGTGIVTFNQKGFVFHANTAAKKMLGVEVLTHVSQLEKVSVSLLQSVKNIQPFERKLVPLTSERGAIQLSMKATSFKAKDNELTLLSIQDIRNELDEKELDSWMKLIRVLMHEIMNSIAPITSLSESLCKYFMTGDRPALPSEVTEATISATLRGLNVIREQGNGLMLFVESYRKLTRLPVPDKKMIRFDDLSNRIKVLYSSLANSDRVKLTVSATPAEMEIFADENQISHVLINLVKNALEANEHNPQGHIRLWAGYNAGQRPEIRVSDNGPGIPSEILEQIFVPFFTTRENGSGIGLSLSRQIMRLHGGSLQVRSNPGKETVFSMTF